MTEDQEIWRDWTALVKQTVARFSRGNIAAQHGSIMLPEEQNRERARVRVFTGKWKERAERARS
jgi:hypothetical protein